MSTARPRLVWYASYGSNLNRDRFACYLRGGRPTGGTRTYTGCRDTSEPLDDRACALPGRVFFAGRSLVWGGGKAFLDTSLPGQTPGRAYLVTVEQYADIVAQEMRRPVGTDVDLTRVLADGHDDLGSGEYDRLVLARWLDGHRVLTFTCPWSSADVELVAPSGAYLGTIATGLMETTGWSAARVAAHLADLPGCETWDASAIAALVEMDAAA